MTEKTVQLVDQLASTLVGRCLSVCTAESCTGGMIATSFTDLAGSSNWFDCGFVSYSNQSKSAMLGVPAALIANYGAVSGAVATAMANGALKNCRADLALSVTGVAGPEGGSADKPVGTVWIGIAGRHYSYTQKYWFSGDRNAVRRQSMDAAILSAIRILQTHY